MTAKEKMQAKVNECKVSLVIDLAWMGLPLGLIFGAGLQGWWLVLFTPMATLGFCGLLDDARRIRNAYKIMRSPQFYLLAVRHDLGGGSEDQRPGVIAGEIIPPG